MAAEMVPGPVVSGKVIGKKLRRTISASVRSEAFSATAVMASSVSLRLSMRQPVAATISPPPTRTMGREMPKNAST